jgi:hypothetical protein
MKWWRHLNRMEDIKLVKKITDLRHVGIRTKGRSKMERRSNKWFKEAKAEKLETSH